MQPDVGNRVTTLFWPIPSITRLLAILGDPEMTAHLCGPQIEARIVEAHHEYLADDAPGGVFAIVLAESPLGTDDRSPAAVSLPESPISVGWIGYWEAELHGTLAW